MKVVIVGGVAGGATAAARIRRLDEQADGLPGIAHVVADCLGGDFEPLPSSGLSSR